MLHLEVNDGTKKTATGAKSEAAFAAPAGSVKYAVEYKLHSRRWERCSARWGRVAKALQQIENLNQLGARKTRIVEIRMSERILPNIRFSHGLRHS